MSVYNIPGAPTSLEVGDILNCPYSANFQQITLEPGTYKLECWGAQGGSYNNSYLGGKGGYVKGDLKITEPTALHLVVGGQDNTKSNSKGATNPGGWNGGGHAKTVVYSYRTVCMGGGGATDIRLAQNDLHSRIIVAGGGSGSTNRSQGWAAGGLNGLAYNTTYQATQTKAGDRGGFGVGGNSDPSYTNYNYAAAGGGSGWYGGGGYTGSSDSNTNYCKYCGGGSSYVYSAATAGSYPGAKPNAKYYLTDTINKGGNEAIAEPGGANATGHAGNGYIRISILELFKDKKDKKIFVKTGLPTGKEEGTVLYLDGSSYTNKGNNTSLVVNQGGSTISTAQKKYGNSSYLLGPQTNKYITISPTTTPLVDSSKDFTLDWWEYCLSNDANHGVRFCSSNPSTNNFGGLLVGFFGDMIHASSNPASNSWDLGNKRGMLSCTVNQWVHWALVKTQGVIKTYRNGVFFNSMPINGNIYMGGKNYPYAIGEYRPHDSRPFNGYIQNFRISNKALWVKNFTPPALWNEIKNLKIKTNINDGYIPISYLENTRGTYIDTGIYPNPGKTRLKLDAFFPDGNQWDGYFFSRTGWYPVTPPSSCAFLLTKDNANHFYGHYGEYNNSQTYNFPKCPLNQRYILNANKNVWSFLNPETLQTIESHTYSLCNKENPVSLVLQGTNENGVGHGSAHLMKIYSCMIWIEDKLVRNFVPVKRKRNSELGLLDLVEGKFYPRQGPEGEFRAGANIIRNDIFWMEKEKTKVRVPFSSVYTPLTYIQGHNQGRVVTDFFADQNTRIEAKVETINQNSECIFGSGAAWVQNEIGIWTRANNGILVDYWNESIEKPNVHGVNTPFIIKLNKTQLYINDTLLHTFPVKNFTTSTPFSLFGQNRVGHELNHEWSNSKIYWFKLYQNDVLKHYLIPVKTKTNNNLGFFDLITEVFYSEEFPGKLIAGTATTISENPIIWN